MSLMKGDVETVTVEIDPPEAIVDRARRRAGADGDLEAHLLDGCLFDYEWVGVEELATNE